MTNFTVRYSIWTVFRNHTGKQAMEVLTDIVILPALKIQIFDFVQIKN